MHYLYAYVHQLDAVEAVLQDGGLDDVEVHRPFMGKAVIRCGSAESRDHLLGQLELSAAAAA